MGLSWILTLAIISGQLFRIPLGEGGVNLLDITVMLLVFIGLLQTKLWLSKPPLFIASAFFFILIALLSLIFTPLHLTIHQYFNSLFYTIRFSFYILLGWLILKGALPLLKENINKVFIFSGVGLAILGLFQFIFLPDLQFLSQYGWDPHYFRTVSSFLDPNFAGAYFVLTLVILNGMKDLSRMRFLFFFVTYIALLTTFSRSSYLMFLVSGLTISFFKKSKSSGLIIVCLFLGLLLGFHIYTQLVAKPRSIDREQSASFRFNTWQQGLTMFQKFPILGIGYNSYRYALGQLDLADKQFIATHGASSNDSSLLFVAATTGTLGLLCYLFFLGSLVWKTKNYLAVAALTGLLIHSFFANSLFYPPILLWIILSVN